MHDHSGLTTEILRLRSDLAAIGVLYGRARLRRCYETRAFPSGPAARRARALDAFRWLRTCGQTQGGRCASGAGRRGVPRLPGSARIRINGQEFEASIPQQVRFEAATAAYNGAIATVRQIDPSYTPRPSAYEPGIEGEIAARLGDAQEAAARLRQLTRSPYRADTLDDLIFRDGQPVGFRYPGSSERIRTVSKDGFDEIVGKILCDSGVQRIEPISPTYQGVSYRLRDGSVVGLRMSRQNGLTLDSQQPARLFYDGPDRIHQR